MSKNKTAWYNADLLPKEMVKGALGGLWGSGRCENTEQFKLLMSFLENLNFTKIADIGCGAGEIGRIYSQYDYLGLDLPHIINNVAKVVNPDLNYIDFDLNESSYEVLKEYDMVICNGVLCEVDNPLDKIKKILPNVDKYFLIHRQFFSDSNQVKMYKTYGNLDTLTNVINMKEFQSLLIDHEIVKSSSGSWGHTILIKKV